MAMLVLFGIFVIVFVCGCVALAETPLANARFPVALCVAGLSILALLADIGPNVTDIRSGWLGAVLLPYEVLAISLVLLFVVRLVLAVTCWRSSARQRRRRRWRCECRDAARIHPERVGWSGAKENSRRESRQLVDE